MDDEKKFEVRNSSRVVGPVSLDQIRRGVEAGKIPPESEGRLLGSQADWTPITRIIESPAPESSLPTLGRGSWILAATCFVGIVVLFLTVGREDRAKADYERCSQMAEANSDLQDAFNACSIAMTVDPKSKSGMAAAALLETLEPRRAAERKAKAEKAQADEARRRAEGTAAVIGCKEKDQHACSAACAYGDSVSCGTFGRFVMDEMARTDESEAKLKCFEPLKMACEANIAEACFHLADCIALRADSLTATRSEREPLWRKACTLGYGPACCHVALNFEQDENMKADLRDRCATLSQKNCDDGDAEMCSYAGILFEVGRDVPANKKKAAALYRKGCNGGSDDGCRALRLLGGSPQAVAYTTRTTCPGGLKAMPAHQGCWCGSMPAGFPNTPWTQAPWPTDKSCSPVYPTAEGSDCIWSCH